MPDGFVVTARSFKEFAMGGRELPQQVTAEIRAHLEHHGDQAFAVRSSSTAEDSADAAFAGQHETYLNIRGTEQILLRVRDCFLSLWNERAVAYRQQRGMDEASASMAVVVQRLVPCDAAGVAFSLDPVSGDAKRVLIDANRGLGESVVGGETEVDHWVIARDGLIVIEESIATKTSRTIPVENGIRHQELSGEEARAPSLTAAQTREVAKLVLEVERKAVFPQDIEWGFAGDELWLLQARPITTLPERWTREESAERFPTPISPLTWEFVEAGFHDSLAWSLKLMGMPPCPGRWFASFDHYIYGNQNLVERYCRLPFHADSLEELDAVIPRIKEEFRWVQELPVDWMRDLDGYLIGIGKAESKDLGAMSERELWEHTKNLVQHGSDYFLPNIAISITHGLLCRLLHKLVGFVVDQEEVAGMFQALLAWGNTKTSQINRELKEIAGMIRADAGLSLLVTELPSGELLAGGLNSYPLFEKRLAKFLNDHGHRETDFDMYHAPWGDAPAIVLDHLRAIAGTTDSEPRDGSEHQAKLAAHQAEQRFLDLAPRSWRFFFSEILRLARVYTQLDDLEHYHTTRLNRPIRKALGELGTRLQRQGQVEEPMDVFFARREQIEDLLDNAGNGHAFSAAVRAQKLAYTEARRRDPGWTPWEDEVVGADGEGRLKGMPGSPGIAEGLVYHVRGPGDFAAFPAGAVLVSRTTNPAWTPLFHLASAVITESGGPLSHGAVTARELGIPSVMSVPKCLSLLEPGSRVRVDGLKGLVMPV